MMFEESLQEQLESSPEIETAAQAATEIITKNIGIASLADIGTDPNQYRKNRIDWICHTDRLDCLNPSKGLLDEDATIAYSDKGWDGVIKAHCETKRDSESNRLCVGYGKLLKMLYTQFPYFGGSTEFKKGTLDLEYWLYQLSTITKDPERAVTGTNLPKALLDYRTPDRSLLPINNPRNLGLGITDGPSDHMSFRKLPQRLQRWIFRSLNNPLVQENRAIQTIFGRFPRGNSFDTSDALATYWDNLDGGFRKRIYGDVLRIPWSFAHILGHESPSASVANVVGVRGNILLTPDEAEKEYRADYDKKNSKKSNSA